ncbi:hypothetical protein ACFYZT_33210 [Streptomyces sp. NPDC001591]|uniref:hypothetical protein n=1 Tax=Streptomyces sp. NPDC001591 TaxID=3364589 RepID=UPI0036904904
MDAIVRAAGELVGTELSGPVDLGGSARSTVLRCRTAGGGSVIVKAFGNDPGSLRCFTAEAAGLSLAIAGPEVLGVDPEVPLLVTADLGDAPTLADLLLGDDPAGAESGLLGWSRELGALAAASVHRRAELARLWSRYDKGMPSWEDEPWTARNAADLPVLLGGAAIPCPAGLEEELSAIGTAGGGAYPAFTPGDTCPDNCLITPAGPRLIDFEAACYQSVFLTAAYCRMPFSSCWCVFVLPPGLAAEMERAYRAEIVGVYPALAEDEVWEAGMRRATAVWTVDATVRLLPRVVEDGPLHRTRRPVPTRRQLLAHRWRTATGLEEFPALGETMRLLLREVAGAWEAAPLPLYPAFGNRGR